MTVVAAGATQASEMEQAMQKWGRWEQNLKTRETGEERENIVTC